MCRQDEQGLKAGMGKPLDPQAVAPSLHLSFWGCMFSQQHGCLCDCSIVSMDQLSLLTQGFSAPPSFWLACDSHSNPVSTLPPAQLPTANWLNGPIPNSQKGNFIGQLWSGVPLLVQPVMPRVYLVVHEA
jgi:hypothetical protein